MTTIDHITVEADSATSPSFYADAFDLGDRVRVGESSEPTSGFRGWILGLVTAQPSDVDTLLQRAIDAGATSLAPGKKSMWGYGGAVKAPDGTIVTVASESKKDKGPSTAKVQQVVVQLGVSDTAASKEFYVGRGFEVTQSYGRRYVEFSTGPMMLTLLPPKLLAKTADVAPDGSGSHRLLIASDQGAFSDPDGYVWQ